MAIDTERLINGILRHEVWLDRYKGGASQKLLTFLGNLRKQLEEQIAAVDIETRSRARVNRLLAQVNAMIEALMGQVQGSLSVDLREVLNAENLYQRSLAGNIGIALPSLDRLSLDIMYSAAMSQPFQGAILSEWYQAQTQSTKRAVSRVLRQSYAEGVPLREITTRLRQVWPAEQRKLEALARTAIAHMANFASRHLMEQAEVKYWQYISVLDSRTSIECRARSNQVYTVRPDAPWPPRHYSCRSTALMLSNNQGVDIPGATGWLKSKSAFEQNDILGPTRAKLFRNGLSLRQLINSRGDELTLDELQQRYPRIWREAGIDDAA